MAEDAQKEKLAFLAKLEELLKDEVDARREYEEAMNMTEDREAREVLFKISREEGAHFDSLKELREKVKRRTFITGPPYALEAGPWPAEVRVPTGTVCIQCGARFVDGFAGNWCSVEHYQLWMEARKAGEVT